MRAQTYPVRPIKLIVPLNAGGAAGILGTDAVAKAAPDGYTFVLSLSNSLMTNQFLYDKLPYNTQRDLALVSHIASAPVTLVVHPSVPASNGPELLQYIAANKKKLSYGSWGVGSYAHLTGSHMSLTQQADMVHTAYKGEAPMLQDLIGGQLQMAYASAAGSKPHIEAGRLKIIGTPEAFAASYKRDMPIWKKLVKQSSAKLE